MNSVVTDTHTVLWYLSADPRLSRHAKEAVDKATYEGEPVFVPTICIVEATYLIEKNRIPAGALVRLEQAVRDPDSPLTTAPLTVEIAFLLSNISRNSVPDLPDRVIAATALALGLPLVTRDAKIRASGIETIW
jgi:PIN domain nuclease of toxin-antitoxin system